jgi:DNA-binding IclR family transcriptional regulator
MSSSASRALRILELVAAADEPPGVTAIARALSLSPATVFRALDALSRADLVARYQASSRYVPGPAAERLSRTLIARFPMREIALPYLRQLASVAGDTTSLHVRIGWYAVRIASVTGDAQVTYAPPLGGAAALGQSYAGRAILAFLDAAEWARYDDWAAKHGAARADEQGLRAIGNQGFALGEPQGADGRAAVAFPIRTRDTAAAALTIDTPALHVPPHAGAYALHDWRKIVSELESIGQSQPSLFETPFAHLDPDSIVL